MCVRVCVLFYISVKSEYICFIFTLWEIISWKTIRIAFLSGIMDILYHEYRIHIILQSIDIIVTLLQI